MKTAFITRLFVDSRESVVLIYLQWFNIKSAEKLVIEQKVTTETMTHIDSPLGWRNDRSWSKLLTKRFALILPYIYIYVKNIKKQMYNAIFLWKNFFYKTIRTRSNIVITYMYIRVYDSALLYTWYIKLNKWLGISIFFWKKNFLKKKYNKII